MNNSKKIYERYVRQIALSEVGKNGQKKLTQSKILIVGLGGLGSPAVNYLAGAGIGTIGLLDNDRVEEGNLQRQIIYNTSSIGKFKSDECAFYLKKLNPYIKVRKFKCRFDDNCDDIVKDYDFVIDATDNVTTRLAIARICHKFFIPYSHGGICKFYGQTMTVIPGKTACLGCLFENVIEEENVGIGPMGFVPGIIGAIQAAEAIKFLLGIGSLLTNRVLIYDALNSSFREIPIKRSRFCSICAKKNKKEGK